MATTGIISDYLENYLLKDIFENVSASITIIGQPTLHVALFTSTTTDAGGGTEVTGGSYARKDVTSSSGWDTTTANDDVSNNGTITFVTATAVWGLITGFAIYDAATSGNSLVHGDLASDVQINSSDTFEFADAALVITFD